VKLFINGIEGKFDFDQAIKYKNNLYLKKAGKTVVAYEGISDFSAIILEGGEFEIEQSPEEKIAEESDPIYTSERHLFAKQADLHNLTETAKIISIKADTALQSETDPIYTKEKHLLARQSDLENLSNDIRETMSTHIKAADLDPATNTLNFTKENNNIISIPLPQETGSGGGNNGVIGGADGIVYMAAWTPAKVEYGSEVYLRFNGQSVNLTEYPNIVPLLKIINPAIIQTRLVNNNSPVPFEASASSVYSSNEAAYFAFRQTGLTQNGATWASSGGYNSITGEATTPEGQWLQIKLDHQYSIYGYSITIRNLHDGAASGPSNFTLQGSNDGTTWTVIDTVSGAKLIKAETGSFFLKEPSAYYQYFRLVVTKTRGYENGETGYNGAYYVTITNLSFFDNDAPISNILPANFNANSKVLLIDDINELIGKISLGYYLKVN
jgi:hypothetical protein